MRQEHSGEQGKCTLFGSLLWSSGGILLAPCGLSLFPVTAAIHLSRVTSSTASGWTLVSSSVPQYNHMQWLRNWRGWMRRLRKTSKRSMPVTPSRTYCTTRSINIFTSAFSSGISFRGEGLFTRSMVNGGSPLDCPGVDWT